MTANQDGEAAADASMSASGIYDEADLLSADEEASLLTKLEKYSERYSADIAIVTTDDAGGLSAQAYADAYAEKIGQSMSRDEYPRELWESFICMNKNQTEDMNAAIDCIDIFGFL